MEFGNEGKRMIGSREVMWDGILAPAPIEHPLERNERLLAQLG